MTDEEKQAEQLAAILEAATLDAEAAITVRRGLLMVVGALEKRFNLTPARPKPR